MPVRFVAQWISRPALISDLLLNAPAIAADNAPALVSGITGWTLTAEGLVQLMEAGTRGRVSDSRGRSSRGFCMGATLGSYVHLNLAGVPQIARRFVAACAQSKRSGTA